MKNVTNVELTCPFCDQPVQMPQAQLVENVRIRCLHCGGEAVLDRDFDERAGRSHWALFDPEAEEPGPRAPR